MWLKGLFLCQNLWLQMVKNVIKGSFPMSKVLVFEGNSYVCWKNEDIRLFYDCKW